MLLPCGRREKKKKKEWIKKPIGCGRDKKKMVKMVERVFK